jgi:hypothetical protein
LIRPTSYLSTRRQSQPPCCGSTVGTHAASAWSGCPDGTLRDGDVYRWAAANRRRGSDADQRSQRSWLTMNGEAFRSPERVALQDRSTGRESRFATFELKSAQGTARTEQSPRPCRRSGATAQADVFRESERAALAACRARRGHEPGDRADRER